MAVQERLFAHIYTCNPIGLDMLPESPTEVVIAVVALLALAGGIVWIVKSQAKSRERTQARLDEIQARLKEIEKEAD